MDWRKFYSIGGDICFKDGRRCRIVGHAEDAVKFDNGGRLEVMPPDQIKEIAAGVYAPL